MADLKLSLLLKAVDKGAKNLLKSTKSGVAGLTAENKKAAGVEKLVKQATDQTTMSVRQQIGALQTEMAVIRAGNSPKARRLLALKREIESLKRLDDEQKRNAESSRRMALGVTRLAGSLIGFTIVAATAAAAAAIIIPARLFKFGEKAAKDLAVLGEEADSLGVTVERLQELREAFRMNDKEVSGATDLYAALGKAQGAALKKGSTQAAMFKSIGVSVRNHNGQLKPLPQLLEEAADGYAKIQHQAKRAKIAQGLFGGEAKDLNPILKGGAASLREWADQARRNGEFSSQQRREATAARTSYLQLTGSVKGLSNVLAANLFPILKQATDATRKWFDNTANRKSIIDAITDSTKALGKALPQILPLIPQFLDATTKLFTQTDWEKAADDIGQVASAIVGLAKAIGFVSKVGGFTLDAAQAIAGNGQPMVQRLMRDQERRRRARAASGAGPEPGFSQPAKPAGVPYQSLGPGRAKPAKGQIDITVRHDGPPKVTTRSGEMAMTVYRGAH